MRFVKHGLQREFLMPLKTNRQVALRLEDQKQGQYVRIDSPALEPDTVMTRYLERDDFPLHPVKQIFTNADGSTGILYLVTGDLDLPYTGSPQAMANDGPWNRITSRSSKTPRCPSRRPKPSPRQVTSLRVAVHLHQTGDVESLDENQSFCLQGQALHECPAFCVSDSGYLAACSFGCVASVTE